MRSLLKHVASLDVVGNWEAGFCFDFTCVETGMIIPRRLNIDFETELRVPGVTRAFIANSNL
jgi:hypothetical protein